MPPCDVRPLRWTAFQRMPPGYRNNCPPVAIRVCSRPAVRMTVVARNRPIRTWQLEVPLWVEMHRSDVARSLERRDSIVWRSSATSRQTVRTSGRRISARDLPLSDYRRMRLVAGLALIFARRLAPV